MSMSHAVNKIAVLDRILELHKILEIWQQILCFFFHVPLFTFQAPQIANIFFGKMSHPTYKKFLPVVSLGS